jgi:NADPH-dependent curcumin reductase CurA
MEDLCAALDATQMPLRDIIDSVEPFEKAEEAIEYLWQGRQVGKVVLRV